MRRRRLLQPGSAREAFSQVLVYRVGTWNVSLRSITDRVVKAQGFHVSLAAYCSECTVKGVKELIEQVMDRLKLLDEKDVLVQFPCIQVRRHKVRIAPLTS